MGAAEQQQLSQYPLRYGDGTLGAAIAQTRDGKDELVTPVALWELDDTSGLYLPPGLSQNPRRPRVDAQLSGSIAENLATRMLETLAGSRSGPIGAGVSEVLTVVQQPCDLESLSVGGDYNFRLGVHTRLADGTWTSGMRLVRADGSATDTIRPLQLHDLEGHNDFWREFVYDPEGSRYAVGMTRQAKFGAGIRITVENGGTSEQNVAATWMISKFAV